MIFDKNVNEADHSLLTLIVEKLLLPTQDVTVKNIEFDPIEAACTHALYSLEYKATKLILKFNKQSNSKIIEVTNFITQQHTELMDILKLPILAGALEGMYFEVLPFAPGTAISDLHKKYLNDEVSAAYLDECYFKLGEALSYIHFKGKVTDEVSSIEQVKTSLLHGDLHGGNIFYSDEGKISLIDNDGFVKSIDAPEQVTKDLYAVLNQSVNFFTVLLPSEVISEQKRADHIIFAEAFLKGYSSHLDEIKYADFLTNIVKEFISSFYHTECGIPLINEIEAQDIIAQIAGDVFPSE